MDNYSADLMPKRVANSLRDHWILFVAEGSALIVMGLLAIIVPSIDSGNLTAVLGWLFLISGAIGLATTYWARQAPGVWWCPWYRLYSQFLLAWS